MNRGIRTLLPDSHPERRRLAGAAIALALVGVGLAGLQVPPGDDDGGRPQPAGQLPAGW